MYPRMKTKTGAAIDVLSPNAPANLDADRAAFVALMKHLREVDAQHTVLMMQVENESGSLGSVRDFGAVGQKEFEAQVPAEVVGAAGKKAGTWAQVFGDYADETFAAWSVARYINAVAAAGKKELALPMYVNNWLKSPRAYPITTVPGEDYPSGETEPTINMMGGVEGDGDVDRFDCAGYLCSEQRAVSRSDEGVSYGGESADDSREPGV